MENIELGRASIDEDVMLSNDVETEESTDTELLTSIDTAQPEAGTEIPVEINPTLIKGEEIRLPLQDYLDPGRTYSNSGKCLATNTKNNTEIGSSANADETGKNNSQPILLDDPDPKPSRENRKSTTEKNKKKTIDLEVEDDSDIEAEIDRQYGNHVDRPVNPVVDQLSDNPIDRHSTQPEPMIERVYRTLPLILLKRRLRNH
ncbi:hypothetical protein DY000_02008534 [Brassica cretica]|uniref:Uncharacterized protein n=1 Tax=Brassica cretica TaxID=69181 RepID=A0ABQ7BZF9_BRACR|nr:hypothetical protein DY000_02008534 [Brassica cretica]